MNVAFATPWLLALLALAVVPLLRAPARRRTVPWIVLLPADRWSNALGWLLRALHAAAIALIVLALARPYSLDEPVQRVGRGAEIVILLDRSRSMDQPFLAEYTTGAQRIARHAGAAAKASIARKLLLEFAQRRTEDRFALVAFSAQPIPVLPLTRDPRMIAAALSASDLRPALGDTDIGRGLLGAVRRFEDQPYRGSRVVLLASDGGGHIDADVQREIALRFRKARATLYWLYIRSFGAPSLKSEVTAQGKDTADVVAEQSLHRFFSTMGVPYRAFQADNPAALQEAIDEVGRLERAPLDYTEVQPRREFERPVLAAALACALLLLLVRRQEAAQ
jgi:mxaC protein